MQLLALTTSLAAAAVTADQCRVVTAVVQAKTLRVEGATKHTLSCAYAHIHKQEHKHTEQAENNVEAPVLVDGYNNSVTIMLKSGLVH
eukprot:6436-Heterococcus_DN1.PRE.8